MCQFRFSWWYCLPPGSPFFARTRPVRRSCIKPSFCWRSLAIGQIALVSSSRTAFPVLNVVVACPELSRRDACPESKGLMPLAYLSWPISKRRRVAFFLFLRAFFPRGGFRRVAARKRTAEGLDDEQK